MKGEKIDFSALDPSLDAARWEAMVRSVAARAVARAQVPSIALQLAMWARPAMAIAATIALAIWVGALDWSSSEQTTASDPALLLVSWTVYEDPPSTADILKLGGEQYDRSR